VWKIASLGVRNSHKRICRPAPIDFGEIAEVETAVQCRNSARSNPIEEGQVNEIHVEMQNIEPAGLRLALALPISRLDALPFQA
jgi:hypothetical protein